MRRSKKIYPLLRYVASSAILGTMQCPVIHILCLLGKQIDAIVRQKSDISCAQLVLKLLNPFFLLSEEKHFSLAHL